MDYEIVDSGPSSSKLQVRFEAEGGFAVYVGIWDGGHSIRSSGLKVGSKEDIYVTRMTAALGKICFNNEVKGLSESVYG